jgi:hypothetical protein
VLLSTLHMSFQPMRRSSRASVDCPPSADARMPQLALLARCVDRVATQPAYSAASMSVNQVFMAHSCHVRVADGKQVFVEGALERAGDVADALLSGFARLPAMLQPPTEREVVPRAPIVGSDQPATLRR